MNVPSTSGPRELSRAADAKATSTSNVTPIISCRRSGRLNRSAGICWNIHRLLVTIHLANSSQAHEVKRTNDIDQLA